MRRIALPLMLLLGCSPSAVGSHPAAGFNRPLVWGASAPVVVREIRAAEADDRTLFEAQLSERTIGSRPKMELINLRPNCALVAVTQDSSFSVTAKWTCRAGKVDAVATRVFLISHGKIATITGEPIPEYHFVPE